MQPRTFTAEKFFADRMLPVSLVYTRSSEAANWHVHEFSEIGIVFNGSGIYETDFAAMKITAGDVLVMPAGGMHRFHHENDIEQFNILFQFEKLHIPSREICKHPGFSALFRLNPQYCLKNRYYPCFKLNPVDLQRVKNLLTDAYMSQQQQQSGSALSVYGAFLQTIPILLANYSVADLTGNTSANPTGLVDTLDYMQQNFRKNLQMQELAKHARMTVSSFSRHFKAATGTTPGKYLLKLRLDEARQMLLENQLSISEIAFQTGFEDSNYFSRIFRIYSGMSPREFRNRNTQS